MKVSLISEADNGGTKSCHPTSVAAKTTATTTDFTHSSSTRSPTGSSSGCAVHHTAHGRCDRHVACTRLRRNRHIELINAHKAGSGSG